ncbi:Do family serine endopeptidase [Hufsiella ginkgonis]|uniref:Do family serine endopeptidase n=1 Tax=Hufsiella ginkgonis TaxID=2695274 RepID=A0A7K1XS00_9SPHI|nr:Do family serine endopeptidase [Hufsiella ginkgonis]MXV13720.1 Do family serine endopeptidase [Hufsiella ginkgonis]
MKKIGITLLTAFVGGAVAIGGYKLAESKYAGSLSLEDKQKVYFTNNPTTAITASTGNLDFTQAAAIVAPGVVHIKTTYKPNESRGGGTMDDMFNEFFGNRGQRMQAQPSMASGSGVIVSNDGYIITNNHVVEDADDITVILTDKRSFKAKVIGRDPNTDLALIKVGGTNLPLVKIGNSDNVRVGEWVLAVGYPFAMESTVTAGIVSAKARSIGILNQQRQSPRFRGNGRQMPEEQPQANTSIESFIQTDAAINRGNSGGALVNANGELIGINSAIASQSGNYEGYGFAIPINLAKKIVDDFMKYGSVKRGYIGVSFDPLDAEKAANYNVKQINGLYVNGVVKGSGAESAGLKEGDVITKVDENEIYASADLQERVGRLHPGDKVRVTYLRDGREYNANIVLKGDDQVNMAANTVSAAASKALSQLGATFAPVNATQKQRFNITAGVAITRVQSGGLLDSYDVPAGTIITKVNGKPVTKPSDVVDAINASKNNMVSISGFTPDGAMMRSTFPIGE